MVAISISRRINATKKFQHLRKWSVFRRDDPVWIGISNSDNSGSSGPTIVLVPSSGQPSTHVLITCNGFSSTDTSCLVGAPGSNVIVPGTQACVMHQGSGGVDASFIINNVAPGQYVIGVSGYPDGGFALATLTIPSATATVTSGPPIPEYQLGLALLTTVLLVANAVIKRRTGNAKNISSDRTSR